MAGVFTYKKTLLTQADVGWFRATGNNPARVMIRFWANDATSFSVLPGNPTDFDHGFMFQQGKGVLFYCERDGPIVQDEWYYEGTVAGRLGMLEVFEL